MNSLAKVFFHASQFPDAVRRQLLESLRTRVVNHKFHYDSVKQACKWMSVHRAYSPYQTDPACAEIYDAAFGFASSRISNCGAVDVIGLGCGNGLKDIRLLELLAPSVKSLRYVPCDVSASLVLIARTTALRQLPNVCCFPFVCDLLETEDLAAALSSVISADAARVITFLGMIPNFEPDGAGRMFRDILRTGDRLLLSANLAPGPDYDAGVRKVLPLYDNLLTREWLTTFLLDLGVEPTDGNIRFVVEEKPPGSGMKRITAWYDFKQDRRIVVDENPFTFSQGESIQLFFSYRYTPEQMRDLLAMHGLRLCDQWIAASGEEGVFLCEGFNSNSP